MDSGATLRSLVVGRLRKPHGLKGEVAVFPLTDDPETVFVAGRVVSIVDLEGKAVAGPLEIARARTFHREWLLAFRGRDSRAEVEHWGQSFLTASVEDLDPPTAEEVYLHDLVGFAARAPNGQALGLVTAYYEMPAGLMLEIQGPKREFLVPFRKEFVRDMDRELRQMVLELPEGL
jgi:16S rRNA processing protein RimM